jgi:hypothetical protein
MTKPLFQNDKKKYIDFLMHLDEKCCVKSDKKIIKTKEDAGEYIKKLDNSYIDSYSDDEVEINCFLQKKRYKKKPKFIQRFNVHLIGRRTNAAILWSKIIK